MIEPSIKTVSSSNAQEKAIATVVLAFSADPVAVGSIPIRTNICSIYRVSCGPSPAKPLNTTAPIV